MSVTFERNDGIPLDLAWVNDVRINQPAVIRRAVTHAQRRTVKKEAQLGWLLRCVSLIDLTTLAGSDTPSNVQRLCDKAKHPLRNDFEEALNVKDKKIHCAAICVYPNRVKDAKKALEGTDIPVASVAAGFPAGQTPMPQRLAEIEMAVSYGADEIDIVISREFAINSQWDKLYDEVKQFRAACKHAHLKTILATGDLPTFTHIYKASIVCCMAGADFIKTSTGKESVNATLPVGFIMARAVRDYYERTGKRVGFKPAGGIRSAKDACTWLSLMYEELGPEWTYPNLFRIGASSLLLDIERQLGHGISGNYSAEYYMPAQ